MHIESLKLTNFRCCGPETVSVPMAETFTAFVGDNGSGKTAIMYSVPSERNLSIEVVLAFSELQDDEQDRERALPSPRSTKM